MNPQEYNALHILHVLGAIGMVAATFYAFAAAPETRKRTLMWSGIATLLVLLTGIRMWQALYQFSGGWAWVKVASWLVLAATTGSAYRKRCCAPKLAWISMGAAAIALVMVYVRPF